MRESVEHRAIILSFSLKATLRMYEGPGIGMFTFWCTLVYWVAEDESPGMAWLDIAERSLTHFEFYSSVMNVSVPW